MNLNSEHCQFSATPNEHPGGKLRGLTITIDCETERTQHKNKQIALRLLELAVAGA